MTQIIGVTGGIGSGKSTLVDYLRKKNFYVHDSDEVVKKIYESPSKLFKNYLIKLGLKKAIKNKEINKKIIANEIFSNDLLKKKLESIIHKEVKKNRNKFINLHKKKKTNVVFIDVPLLFENNLDNLFHKVLCVLCSKKIRLKRVMRNKGISANLFKKIIKNQTSNVERKKRASYCIINNNTKNIFFKNVDNFIKTINL